MDSRAVLVPLSPPREVQPMSASAPVTWPPSLWAATAPAGPALAALEGEVQADVVVIGAGFTGLSTAIHLREAGVDVVVVEAAEPGWGASGRNNGQVIPTLAGHDPSAMVARHGEAGERFNAVLRDSAQYLFDTVANTTFPPKPSRRAGFSRCIRRAASSWPRSACANGRRSGRRSSCSTGPRPRG